MMDPDYDKIVPKLRASYSCLSMSEQKMVRQILSELASTGYSYTYEQIYLSDFKEIPVSVDQFLDDSYYLGETNNNGKSVYPFWRRVFNDVFSSGNKYNEIILSGATRIGKSTGAVTISCYMLYRLMLYRNPHAYFGKKPVSKFTIGFANLTKELATSIAFREFNDTLKQSPWFMEHGSITRSDRNFYYLPEGDRIEIIPASSGEQLLGKQVWCCVTGDTKLITCEGIHDIASLDGQTLCILQYDSYHKCCQFVEGTISLTKYVQDLIEVELDDGTIFRGTPDHRVMLSDGSYKRLDELTEDDDIMEV